MRWDINSIDPSETVTLALQYGPGFTSEFIIKENVDVSLEEFEWTVKGVLPYATSRIKMTFNNSGEERYSEEYEVAPPFFLYSDPC